MSLGGLVEYAADVLTVTPNGCAMLYGSASSGRDNLFGVLQDAIGIKPSGAPALEVAFDFVDDKSAVGKIVCLHCVHPY